MSAESHSLAISMEWALRRIFNCERFGLGGFIDSDSIERNPMQSFRLGFAVIYPNSSRDKKAVIDAFIDGNYQYEEQNIDEIGVEIVAGLHEEFTNIFNR